jgi:hypothetical protein
MIKVLRFDFSYNVLHAVSIGKVPGNKLYQVKNSHQGVQITSRAYQPIHFIAGFLYKFTGHVGTYHASYSSDEDSNWLLPCGARRTGQQGRQFLRNLGTG